MYAAQHLFEERQNAQLPGYESEVLSPTLYEMFIFVCQTNIIQPRTEWKHRISQTLAN